MNCGFEVCGGKFLGSKDRIIVAGGMGPSSGVHIYYDDFLNGVDGRTQFVLKNDVFISGTVNAVELCGIPRLMKTVVAVGGVSAESAGFIELLNVETKRSLAQLSLQPASSSFFQSINSGSIAPVTSMVFNSDREVLVVGTEDGEVILIDLHAEKELHRMQVDATGVVKLAFNAAGQLVTLGNSTTEPAKVWDVRYNSKPTDVLRNVANLDVTVRSPAGKKSLLSTPLVSEFSRTLSSSASTLSMDDLASANSRRTTAPAPSFTALAPHPTQSKLFLGNTQGSLVLWDLRSNANLIFQPHISQINEIVVHPEDSSQIITCSTDGTIKQTNTLRMPLAAPSTVFQRTLSSPAMASTLSSGGSGTSSFEHTDSFDLLTPGYSVNSLDCDAESRSLLATTEFGQVFKLQLQ